MCLRTRSRFRVSNATRNNLAAVLDDFPIPATVFAIGHNAEFNVRHALFPSPRNEYQDDRDFDAVFERLIQFRVGALVIGPDNFFTSHSEQLAKLTIRHEMPAIYEFRKFAAAGGLMSYGSSETEYYRLVGTYAARVLKGDKPADLPVQQSTKVELIINLKTAKVLGLTVPLPLSGRADELIE